MKNCPPDDQFSVCESRGNYTYVLGSKGPNAKRETRQEVGALLKNNGSILINFESKLRALQARSFPYSSVNRYLRIAITDDMAVGLFNLKESMTFNPRSDPPKDYNDAYLALQQVPSGFDVSVLFDVVNGLPDSN